MRSTERWNSFEEVYCLTLEGDTERQRHASAELCRLGLNGFRFIEGIKADSDAVRGVFESGRVRTFPPCFRCGLTTCGSPDCNNVLIEPQVGCFLSFIKIFQTAVTSGASTFIFMEDDIKFHDYAHELADAAFTRERLEHLGFFSNEPCLIGLGRGAPRDEIFQFDGTFDFLSRRKMPQNPCFAFNRSFAQLALSRFHKISHTSDVFIHFDISDAAHHFSLEPPLSYELSASTGELESRIHPKRIAFESLANDDETRRAARARFDAHIKHVKYVPLVVMGIPRGGTAFMANALTAFGFDVGHEALRADGISSWMFAVDDVNLPFGADLYARNSRFVHPRTTIAVVRTSPRTVFSLQLENGKNIQSYSFRRKWIKARFDIDVDDFATDFERALATYVYWYRIIESRAPAAWICLERAAHDLTRLFSSGFLDRRKEPELSRLSEVVNSRKPYLGQTYDVPDGDFEQCLASSDPYLVKAYRQLKGDLFHAFYGQL